LADGSEISMRERLVNLARQLREYDKRICGDAPTWIVKAVASRLEAMLLELPGDEELRPRLEPFLQGAARYVTDQCGCECDMLLSALDSLMRDQ